MNRGFEEVRVKLDEDGTTCEKIFQGKLIARKQLQEEGFELAYRLYETPRGKLACVVRKNPAWQNSTQLKERQWAEMSQDLQWWQPHYQLYVADDYQELKQQLGDTVVDMLQGSVAPTKTEYLDI